MTRKLAIRTFTWDELKEEMGIRVARPSLGDGEDEGVTIMKKIKEVDVNGPWWDASSYNNFGGATFDTNWVQLGLEVIALAGGPPRLYTYKEGTPKEGYDAFLKKVESLGGKLVSETKFQDKTFTTVRQYIWPHGCFEIKFNGDAKVECALETNNREFFDNAFALIQEDISTKPPAGRVHVVVSTNYGPEFESMGIGGHDIERGNYSDEVLVAFDKIITDLKSNAPTGRLSIFNGPPGTGKTYLIRAILQAADNSICVVVPANLLQELSSPSVIPSLIELRKSKGENVPIVFLVEDADECLVTREDGNMSSISAVLNLCDGILGTLLDIRIIATTNADKMQLDKALVRPGRLSANVEVGSLPYEKALEVIQRLSGPDAVLPKETSYSLAELYNLSKSGTVKATGVKEKKRSMGFGS